MTQIEELRKREKALLKQAESDACLIESLNRYIETLEGKIKYQTDFIKTQKEQLETLLAAYSHK